MGNDYGSTYCDLLARAKLSLLYLQRLRQVLTEVYKIVHNESPMYISIIVKVKNIVGE